MAAKCKDEMYRTTRGWEIRRSSNRLVVWKAESRTARTCDSRYLKPIFDAAEGAGNRGHGDEGAGAGGLMSVGLVRGARGGSGGERGCVSGCFLQKFGEISGGDAAEFSKLWPKIDEF